MRDLLSAQLACSRFEDVRPAAGEIVVRITETSQGPHGVRRVVDLGWRSGKNEQWLPPLSVPEARELVALLELFVNGGSR